MPGQFGRIYRALLAMASGKEHSVTPGHARREDLEELTALLGLLLAQEADFASDRLSILRQMGVGPDDVDDVCQDVAPFFVSTSRLTRRSAGSMSYARARASSRWRACSTP